MLKILKRLSRPGSAANSEPPLTTIVDNSKLFTSSEILRNGEAAQFRPLRIDDATQLGIYFEGLSAETRSRYGPHKFSMEVAEQLCAQIGRDDTVRMVVVTGQDGSAEIIAYFILDFDIPSDEQKRYLAHGIPLNSSTDCRLAPSVADQYQDTGVGSALMPICKEVARHFGQKRMILMGGVLVRNHRAIHFYKKHGFRQVGGFHEGTDKASYDMILTLAE